ncbi:MAG: NAD(P)-dependent alcohol dehydrogenase [Caldilineaceae bacterium]|nr:NAD(P)-dependent alcohol dehydrogenase [Caldilineaceae bacterium]
MKAITYTQYGPPDVLKLQDVEKPTPKDDEVLVKIHAASVNALDWHLLTADIFLIRVSGEGMFKPKRSRLGADMAGRVEAAGSAVTQFKPGDAVYGDIEPFGSGAFAEYTAVPAKALAPKPPTLTFAEAAALPVAALTALQGLRDVGKIQAGQRVLINGASGGVGTFAVQIAKAFGAEVTAVCSTRNVEQARALGADHVIDYTQTDFTQNGQQYDLIFAANGYHPLAAYKRALAPGGIYVMAGGKTKQIFDVMLWGWWHSRGGDKKLTNVMAHASVPDLLTLNELVAAGKVKPVVDRRYPLSQTADALRYLGEGHARGKIVIDVADSEQC